jgi:asparagine synthase (glutamine-hydrolysing)
MPHDILTKVDRASMQHSLEARVPLLDHRIVEYGWRVPMEHKIRNGKGKWILREILKDYVSESLFNRPKQGFGVPIDTWLRGPLKEWASELLDPTRLAQEGFLNPEPITQRWQEHLSGTRNWQYSLWGILMFQAWWEHYRGMVRGKAT